MSDAITPKQALSRVKAEKVGSDDQEVANMHRNTGLSLVPKTYSATTTASRLVPAGIR